MKYNLRTDTKDNITYNTNSTTDDKLPIPIEGFSDKVHFVEVTLRSGKR